MAQDPIRTFTLSPEEYQKALSTVGQPAPSHDKPLSEKIPSFSDLGTLLKQVVTGGPLVEGLANMPGPLGPVMQGANAIRRELTDPENISSGGALAGANLGYGIGSAF